MDDTSTMAGSQRAADLGALAESTWAERRITVDAPELASVAAWTAAGAARQQQIARAVADATSRHVGTRCALVDLRAYGGAPVAVLTCGERELALVPGGTFEMGLSDEEEAAVYAQSEANAGCTNEYEMYGSLLERVDTMRPLTTVTVGPLLVARGPGEMVAVDAATDALAGSPFRLLSEAEWEYLARGGRRRALTWFGDYVPDDPSHYLYVAGLDDHGANEFGLWGFGITPELCADVYAGSHRGAFTDGSPRRGEGPRVSRGGAGQLYMWQDTGEWQLLLNAQRGPASAWKYEIALRVALGIDATRRS